jgi:8-oxo-dGTP pyrophosphatase MutT (NUDIX family)
MDRTTRYQAAILRNDHILLIKHQFTRDYAAWEIPGGGREEGESAAECITREVREEAGLDIEVIRLLMDRPGHPHTFYQRFVIYHCAPINEPHLEFISDREKIVDARWFDLRDDSQFDPAVIQSAITGSVIGNIRQVLGYTKDPGMPGGSMLIPFDLTCENEVNPINLDTPFPRFSWSLQADSRGQKQSAYQIQVIDGKITLWDSGRVSSTQQTVAYAGAPLTSRQSAMWQVRVWDRLDQPSPYSQASSFRLGLLHPSDWQAEWIGYPADWNGQALYFRRAFRLEKPIRSAWVSIAGLGCYELRLNGGKVGDHVLDPGFTDYGKRVLYATYNLRPFLESGANVFGVILGNGWYGAPKLLLQAEFEYEDGTRFHGRRLVGRHRADPG